MSEPLVRARFVQDWLSLVEHEEDPWRQRFRERLSAADRATIEGASRIGWLPLRYHVLLADILAETFGPTRSHDFYRKAFVQSLSGPILGPLLKSGARLFGVGPASFCRWFHKGWESSFKDAGEGRGEVLAPGHGRITYKNLPDVCIASDAWLTSTVGSAYGVYDWIGLVGVVRQDLSHRAHGIMQVELEWTERAPK